MPHNNHRGIECIQERIGIVLKLGRSLGYWSRGHDYPQWCKQIFQSIELNGKNMLEIGCGKALPCIWASIHGASRVVGLEPLEDGSFDSSAIYSEFKNIVDATGLDNIDMLPTRIQDYTEQKNIFDIVLSVASINHLDEDSCIRLRENDTARRNYVNVFRKIAEGMKDGAKLIILDCSNRNFFADIGLTNPIGRSIEWFKHQTPEIWVELLSECGFTDPKITWPSGRYLRYLRIYNRNKVLSYFLDSYFRIEMTHVRKITQDEFNYMTKLN